MTIYEKKRLISIGKKVQSGYVSPIKFLLLCPVIAVLVAVAAFVAVAKKPFQKGTYIGY